MPVTTYGAIALIPILLLTGCASNPGAVSDDAAAAETAVAAIEVDTSAEAVALREALAAAVDDPAARDGLHLFVGCQGDRGMRAVEVFSDGVGIWDLSRQFRLAPDQLSELLRILDEADLASFREIYGGKKQPDPRQPEETEGHALRVLCRVELKIGGLTKQVAQLGKGEESLELKRLAHDLLDLCEEPGAAGVAAADLADGLRKIVDGELAPEAMRLLLYRKPPAEGAGADDRGFLLRVASRRASTRAYPAEEGLAAPMELELDAADLAALARVLAKNRVERMPPNLWSEDYLDLTVEVLNWKKSVLARAFDGMSEADQAEHQEGLRRVYRALEGLRQRVAVEGEPVVDARD